MTLYLIVCALPFSLQHQRASDWKTFSNRGGWSVQYPPDWKISSCRSCSDPTAPDVFVDFLPPGNGDSGWVMIEHLQDKPANENVDRWLAYVEKSADLNPILHEERFTLRGLPALRVRYRNPSLDETEAVYISSDAQTYSIEYQDGDHKTLESSPNYQTYRRMTKSFTVKH